MDGYKIESMYLDSDTTMFGGCRWVVYGEIGYKYYPGTWSKELAMEFYKIGRDYIL